MRQVPSRRARVGRPAPPQSALRFLRSDMPWQDEVIPALLAGRWTRELLLIRVTGTRDRRNPRPWVEALIDLVLARFEQAPTAAQLVATLQHFSDPDDWDWSPLHPPRRQPLSPTLARVQLHRPMSRVLNRADLLRLLDLSDGELEWFADEQSRLNRSRSAPLAHYRYRLTGAAGRTRLLEIPKPRLKEIQRRLTRHVVARFPLHPAAHGSVVNRSVLSCVTDHAGAEVLVRCDLESFFAAITWDRVRGLIGATGAEEGAAGLMAGLCTACVPAAVRRGLPRPATDQIAAHRRFVNRLRSRHLPQGAPSSPGLANAIGFSLDHRLTLLAAALGARYTRYVDDLIFSGPATLAVGALLAGTRDIAAEEGFRLAERKTAVLRASRRQQALGTVINVHPAIGRIERDRLRAILHNCQRDGVASQCGSSTPAEFRDQLRGKIAWVASIDRGHGERLEASFFQVNWDS